MTHFVICIPKMLGTEPIVLRLHLFWLWIQLKTCDVMSPYYPEYVLKQRSIVDRLS